MSVSKKGRKEGRQRGLNHHLTVHLRRPEKEKQTEARLCQRKERLKINVTATETGRLTEKIDGTKAWFFPVISRTVAHPAGPT